MLILAGRLNRDTTSSTTSGACHGPRDGTAPVMTEICRSEQDESQGDARSTEAEGAEEEGVLSGWKRKGANVGFERTD